MKTVTVTFASDSGPSVMELEALRDACPYLAAVSILDLADRLGGSRDLVVRVGDIRDRPGVIEPGLAVLADAGLRPRPHGLPYGPAWIARELGLAPIRDDEHRWTYVPSFRPELVITASPRGSRWLARADWPSSSLWSHRYNPWLPKMEGRIIPRPGAPEPPPRPLLPGPIAVRVCSCVAEANEHASAVALRAIEQLRSVRDLPRRFGSDGMAVHLELPSSDSSHVLTTWSPGRFDGLGFALADSGIALAMSLPSPELAALLAGSR